MYRDNQEAFDVALAHMRRQGKRAMKLMKTPSGPKAMCVYRGNNDERCGVGALIPDGLYDPEFEGKGAMSVCSHPRLRGWFSNVNLNVLQDIQGAHDHAMDSNFSFSMEQNMRVVADKWRLKYSGPADDFSAPPPESFLEYMRQRHREGSMSEFGMPVKLPKIEPIQFKYMDESEPIKYDFETMNLTQPKYAPQPTSKDICPAEKLVKFDYHF
jgi:hypothetical protein